MCLHLVSRFPVNVGELFYVAFLAFPRPMIRSNIFLRISLPLLVLRESPSPRWDCVKACCYRDSDPRKAFLSFPSGRSHFPATSCITWIQFWGPGLGRDGDWRGVLVGGGFPSLHLLIYRPFLSPRSTTFSPGDSFKLSGLGWVVPLSSCMKTCMKGMSLYAIHYSTIIEVLVVWMGYVPKVIFSTLL